MNETLNESSMASADLVHLGALSMPTRKALEAYSLRHDYGGWLGYRAYIDSKWFAWLIALLQQEEDREELFPQGKWATIQYMQILLAKSAKVEISGTKTSDCPYCGRPFVQIARYQDHVALCEQREQNRLDREWEDRMKGDNKGMIKQLSKIFLFLAFALSQAMAQTPLTYTAAPGTVHCSNRIGQLPAVNHGCVIGGLLGATATQTGNFQTQGLTDGTDFVNFRINPAGEDVLADGTWAPLATIPPAGEPVLFSFDANISDVCTSICSPASGTFHLEGEWAWQYITVLRYRWRITYQEWTNTTPVVVTINQQTGTPILN